MRLRFAPSPTGHLHVGNARTALFNWLLARGAQGTFVLRIEDTDVERSTAESERGILADIAWLGLQWDEGPDVGGPFGPYRQSERLDTYRTYADRLMAEGHAYSCFCSAERLEAQRQAALAEGRVPQYDGTCRALAPDEARARRAAGEPAVVRFRVPDVSEVTFEDAVRGSVTFKREMIGDFVLVRSEGRPAYNFAVVVDDILMGITHVIRGEDHVSNTPRQVLLYRALDATPPRFAHLSLVMGPDHTPLSKRHGATSVAEFRGRGFLPEALVNYLALIGWHPGGDAEILPLAELARQFSLEHVGKSAGVFDVEKLSWMNRHYIKEADAARLADLSLPFVQAAGFVREPTDAARAYVVSLMDMIRGAVDTIADVPARLGFIFAFDPAAALAQEDLRHVVEAASALTVIQALDEELRSAPRLTRETFKATVNRVKDKTGQKGKALFHPIRAALTGQSGGPELDLAVPAIEAGAELSAGAGAAGAGLTPIAGARERVARFAAALAERRSAASS